MNAVTTHATPDSYGARPTFAWLPLDLLQVDERYQRRITEKGRRQVRAIATGFAWSKFQALLVAGPDKLGDYVVIDGQHRLEAAKLCQGITEVPCLIVQAPEVSTQAVAFKGVNKDRTGVTRINIFWADVAAGVEGAVRVRDLCEACGVTISRVGTGRQKPLHTIAVSAIEQLLRQVGEDHIRQGLGALAAAQAEAENAFRATTLKALTYMHALNEGKIDRDRLVRVLADLDLDDKIDEARSVAKSMGGKADFALQALLTRAYNKNLGSGVRLEEPRV